MLLIVNYWYNVDTSFDIEETGEIERVVFDDGQYPFCLFYFQQRELGLPESEAHLSAEKRRLNH